MGFLCWSLFWYALLYVLSSFAIILTRKRALVAFLLFSFGCLVTVLPHGAMGWSASFLTILTDLLQIKKLAIVPLYVKRFIFCY